MKVGIIGAGISGLSAAHELLKRGHEVAIFERDPEVGGLVSVFDFDGLRIERYYHFLCATDHGYFDLCGELGLADRIRWAKARTGFHYDGVTYPFSTPLDLLRFAPVPFSQRVRFGVFALEARLRSEWHQLDEMRAKPWLIDRIGRTAYEVIWHPLLSMKFGEEHEQISAAWVWHRLHRVAQSKGSMGYIEGGSGVLLDALVERIRAQGGEIHAGTGVEQIIGDEQRVHGLKLANGEERSFDAVISTLPLSVVSRLLPGAWAEYQAALARIRYIGVVCAVFRLAKPVTANFWLNIHDPHISTNGIIEYTNLNPLTQHRTHVAYVPYYVPTTHPIYAKSDEEVGNESWESIRRVNPALTDADLQGVRVFRAPFAQGICPVNFLDIQPSIHAPHAGFHTLDSMFLYPEDRTQSGLISLARRCVDEMGA